MLATARFCPSPRLFQVACNSSECVLKGLRIFRTARSNSYIRAADIQNSRYSKKNRRLSCDYFGQTTSELAVSSERVTGKKFIHFGCIDTKSMESIRSSSSSDNKGVELRQTVDLTPLEAKIFDTLLDTLRHFELKTQLRVAGGWVRDKLIGRETNDIDIALDDCMGEYFANKVNDYLKLKDEETHSIGVIKSNPDQSKHLETATMRIHGEWIDFVNLRAESYADNSRIPTVTFGTAKDDALRRDLTINSLFYNINSQTVEDFTGKGISDLKMGLVRTPLPAVQTFLDDPLRILRSIRFAARLDFVMDQELKQAASLPDVKQALTSKVSRERIGKEVELMVAGKNPLLAMQWLLEFGIFGDVFWFPNQSELGEGYQRECVDFFAGSLEVLGTVSEGEFPFPGPDDRTAFLLASLFLPLRSVFSLDRKKKQVPATAHIIKESLKLKNHLAESVQTLHSAAMEFQLLLPQLMPAGRVPLDTGPGPTEADLDRIPRVKIGLLIRRLKQQWRSALLLSTVLDHSSPNQGAEGRANGGAPAGDDSPFKRARRAPSIESARGFLAYVKSLDLSEVWTVKPVLDGRAVMAGLGGKVKGKEIGKWVDEALKWQLAHPHGSAEDCLVWLQQEFERRQ